MMVPVLLLLLVFLLLQPLQLGLVHHFLDQVFLSAHSVSQVLGKVRDQVRDQGLDGKDHMLQKQSTSSQMPDVSAKKANRSTWGHPKHQGSYHSHLT